MVAGRLGFVRSSSIRPALAPSFRNADSNSSSSLSSDAVNQRAYWSRSTWSFAAQEGLRHVRCGANCKAVLRKLQRDLAIVDCLVTQKLVERSHKRHDGWDRGHFASELSNSRPRRHGDGDHEDRSKYSVNVSRLHEPVDSFSTTPRRSRQELSPVTHRDPRAIDQCARQGLLPSRDIDAQRVAWRLLSLRHDAIQSLAVSRRTSSGTRRNRTAKSSHRAGSAPRVESRYRRSVVTTEPAARRDSSGGCESNAVATRSNGPRAEASCTLRLR